MHKIYIEHLMIPQGQFKKGSYAEIQNGNKNLIFTLENWLAFNF